MGGKNKLIQKRRNLKAGGENELGTCDYCGKRPAIKIFQNGKKCCSATIIICKSKDKKDK